MYQPPAVYIGKDTTICPGDTLWLYAQPDIYTSYLWEDSSTTASHAAAHSGTYFLQVTDSNSCINTDTIHISLYPKPDISITNDTAICPGDTLLLTATPTYYPHYLWQNLAEDTAINVSSAGTYWVKVIDSNNCYNSASVNVSLYSLPAVYLGTDINICPGDSLIIYAMPGNYPAYLWHDSSTAPFFTAHSEGHTGYALPTPIAVQTPTQLMCLYIPYRRYLSAMIPLFVQMTV